MKAIGLKPMLLSMLLISLILVVSWEIGQKDPEHQHGAAQPVSAGENMPPTNRLINEASPYLQQHAHNPVDWYPWSEEALARAKAEDKLIFLSIGYSSCHWCHVMEHESFSDPAVAAVMNEHFVNIKVDREQRPDIDNIYMNAVQVMTGSGGWPLSVFLAPDGRPVYGGTYFPPDDHYGRPGFKRLLTALAEAWQERRSELLASADKITDLLKPEEEGATAALTPALLDATYQQLKSMYDAKEGGFGGAPKFPQPSMLAYLLRHWKRTQDTHSLDMVTGTLDAMCRGGIYDHLGGGFHRYATEAHWLVPHFEKMLYDQGQICRVLVDAFRVTGKAVYAKTAREVSDYVLREMTDAQGGFYSAEDADSEGREGAFYVWTPAQIQAVLDPTSARLWEACYGVTEKGNFDHRTSIFWAKQSLAEAAQATQIDLTQAEALLKQASAKLYAARAKRVRPLRDEKIITGWNGLMITALVRAGVVLSEPRYIEAARRAADFVLTQGRHEGRLQRSIMQGQSSGPAYLDDYAFFTESLLALYEATFEFRWLVEAATLAEAMVDLFQDEKGGAFFLTGHDHADLIVRDKPQYDGALPSGNAVAALVLCRLERITTQASFAAQAQAIMTAPAATWQRSPVACVALAAALDYHLSPSQEITLAGDLSSPAGRALVKTLNDHFLPNAVLLHRGMEAVGPAILDLVPYLGEQVALDGKPTVYVCENRACQRPVHTPEALRPLLERSPHPYNYFPNLRLKTRNSRGTSKACL